MALDWGTTRTPKRPWQRAFRLSHLTRRHQRRFLSLLIMCEWHNLGERELAIANDDFLAGPYLFEIARQMVPQISDIRRSHGGPANMAIIAIFVRMGNERDLHFTYCVFAPAERPCETQPNDLLADGGLTTQPKFAWWFDAGWNVENGGIDPDIEVECQPQDYASGRDLQLERGLQELLKLIENQPKTPELGPSRAWCKRDSA